MVYLPFIKGGRKMSTLSTYQNSAESKAAKAYQGGTIQSVAKKYGVDVSRGYADRQAAVAAQAQINAQNAAKRQNDSSNKLNMQKIIDGYRDSASSLDKGYFQQYLGQGQSQVNRGLTGGMVADQNARLAMNKQGELSGLWRTRNQSTAEEGQRYANTSQTIAEALTQIEKERAANAEKMYQDNLYKGYDMLSSDRNYGLQLDNSGWSKYLAGAQFDQQLKAYADAQAAAAAARAAASRRSSSGSGGSGGSGGTSAKKTSLSPSYNTYTTAKKSQAQTNIEKYYTSPAVVAGQRTGSPLFKNPVAPAQNPNLSAWDKMKLLGL
jgi:hypothetical protein